jgi:hypothetical protein
VSFCRHRFANSGSSAKRATGMSSTGSFELKENVATILLREANRR